jgi:hypothetical protein
MPKNPKIQAALDAVKQDGAAMKAETVNALTSAIGQVGEASILAARVRCSTQTALLLEEDADLRAKFDNTHRVAAYLEKLCQEAAKIQTKIIAASRQLERNEAEARALAEAKGYAV